LDNWDVTPDDSVWAAKLWFFANIPVWLCFYLSKLSLLTFYWDLFAQDIPHVKWTLRAAFAVVIIFFLATMLVIVLICIPVPRNWDPSDIVCQDSAFKTNLISWALHFSSDLMIFLLPIRVLNTLKFTLVKKISVYMTFALGFFNLSVCVIRIIVFQAYMDQLSTTMAEILWVLDLSVAVLIAMIVSLRPYLPYLSRLVALRKERGDTQTDGIQLTSPTTNTEKRSLSPSDASGSTEAQAVP